jgi:predicted small secreted protein
MKKTAILAIAAVAVLVAGCNTIRGVGRDFQAAGQGVENCVNGRC